MYLQGMFQQWKFFVMCKSGVHKVCIIFQIFICQNIFTMNFLAKDYVLLVLVNRPLYFRPRVDCKTHQGLVAILRVL